MIRKGRKKRTTAACATGVVRGGVGGTPVFYTFVRFPDPLPIILLPLSLIYTFLHFGRPDFNDFKEEAVAVRSTKKKKA